MGNFQRPVTQLRVAVYLFIYALTITLVSVGHFVRQPTNITSLHSDSAPLNTAITGEAAGRHGDTLLTSSEMRQVLYNDVGPMTVPKRSYGNLIRSRLTRPDPTTATRLEVNYDGVDAELFSESGQSNFIDQRLHGRRNGFFIECGAHDGESYSNSLFFELRRNWTGLLIEPDFAAYKQMLQKNRKAYTFNGCLSPSGHSSQTDFIAGGIYGGIPNEMPERLLNTYINKRLPFKLISTMCFPLIDILDAIGVDHIDYFSLDIEGPELKVLETIDWKRVRIDIMTIEVHEDMKKLNDTRRLMESIGGYREVGIQGLDVIFERTDLEVDGISH